MNTPTSAKISKYGIPVLPIAIVAVLVFCVIAAGLYFYSQQVLLAQTEAGNRLRSVAELKQREIHEWRDERLRDAQIISTNPFFVRRVEQYLQASLSDDQIKDLQDYLERMKDVFGYLDIFIVDSGKTIRLTTGSQSSILSRTDSLNVDEAARKHETILGDLFRDESTKAVSMNILSPVHGIEEDHLVHHTYCYLLFKIDPQNFLFPLIQTNPSPTQTGETILVRREGGEVVYLSKLRYRSDPPLTLRFPIRDYPLLLAVKAVLGYEGTTFGRDYRNVEVLCHICHIEDSPWYLQTKVDESEILKPLRTLVELIFSLVGGSILMLGLLLLLWWKRRETDHIRNELAAMRERHALTEHYSYLTKYANDIILLVDSNEQIIEANDRACSAYGYSHDELLSMHLSLLRDPQHNIDILNRAEKNPDGGTIYETWHVCKDGSRFPVEVSARIITVDNEKYYQEIIRSIAERKKAEETIRLKNLVFDLSIAANSIANINGIITEVNDMFLRIWGYPRREQAIGQNISDFLQNMSEVNAIVQALQEVGQWEGDYVAKRYDGSNFTAYGMATVIKDENGKIIGYQSAVVDITDRKHSEEELRKYQSILNESQRIAKVGGWDYDLDTQKVKWTDEIYRIFGVTKDFDPNNVEGNFQFILLEDRPKTAEAFHRLAETGDPYDLEQRLTITPGSTKWIRSIGLAERKDGKISRLYGIIMDITERKNAEAALRESEARFRGLFQFMSEGMVLHEMVYDSTGKAIDYRILDANPSFEKYTGYLIENARGALASALYQTENPPYIEKYQQVAETGNPDSFEVYFPPLKKHFSISVFSPEQGRFATVFEDITDRVNSEKERSRLINALQAKNRDLEDVIYAASHDLRTPLVNIVGFTQVIEKAVKDLDISMSRIDHSEEVKKVVEPLLKDRLQEPLHFIMSSTIKMDALIGGLLKLSRLGRVIQDKEELDMNHILTEIKEAMAFQIQESACEIVVSSLPTCYADAGLINQVVSNLLDNAIKYRSPFRLLKIQIKGIVQEEEVVYCIEDNGLGIPEDRLETVWRLFYRLDNRNNVSGEGLGLALVRRIIELQGGRVWVESSLNQGSSFYFALPKKN
jgi:PAS domain S-box-containing protein